jgi:hypothetical protein
MKMNSPNNLPGASRDWDRDRFNALVFRDAESEEMPPGRTPVFGRRTLLFFVFRCAAVRPDFGDFEMTASVKRK